MDDEASGHGPSSTRATKGMFDSGMKSFIEQKNQTDPNERELFHGMTQDAVEAIFRSGLDDRFWDPEG